MKWILWTKEIKLSLSYRYVLAFLNCRTILHQVLSSPSAHTTIQYKQGWIYLVSPSLASISSCENRNNRNCLIKDSLDRSHVVLAPDISPLYSIIMSQDITISINLNNINCWWEKENWVFVVSSDSQFSFTGFNLTYLRKERTWSFYLITCIWIGKMNLKKYKQLLTPCFLESWVNNWNQKSRKN